MPDLGIPPFVINWFMQDPSKAPAAIACVGFGIWAMLNLDCAGGD